MGDRTTEFRDCPKCGSKGTFECYEALSSNTKLDECSRGATTKSLEIIWKRINRHGRYYDKPMKYTEFAAAIDNLIRKERSQAIASYKKVLAEEARLKGGIDADQ